MFRKNLTLTECAKLIETWEIHRLADGYENVFDMRNKRDFWLMVGKRGLLVAIKMRHKNRYWFDGENYNEPKEFPATAESARQIAESLIEQRYIEERPDLYKAFI